MAVQTEIQVSCLLAPGLSARSFESLAATCGAMGLHLLTMEQNFAYGGSLAICFGDLETLELAVALCRPPAEDLN